MVKKSIRKKIIDKAKKNSICPNCKELNGDVKKVTGSMKTGSVGGSFLKILHEKYRSKKEKDPLVKKQLAEFNTAVEMNPEIQAAINSGLIHVLTPIEVLKLFERIPEEDIPLLAMNSSKYLFCSFLLKCYLIWGKFHFRAHPKDLIFTRMLVPPVCIRPSVVSDLKAGT